MRVAEPISYRMMLVGRRKWGGWGGDYTEEGETGRTDPESEREDELLTLLPSALGSCECK